ncbi:helix-hairpin-helix domain-containing protein [Micromonospora sp. NPDC048169]|uniref:helix-hairpin-helix domain-containing protein n=1 Tax=Micromonospora sp. NPDC048169 TaxID=3154711 RepID=UPI0033CB823D
MPSSFGQWLFVILALLIGFGAGWFVVGRRSGAPATPSAETAPEVTATVDEPRPVAVVDEPPATATVAEQPAPTETATAEPAVATAAEAAAEPEPVAEAGPVAVATDRPVEEPAATVAGADQSATGTDVDEPAGSPALVAESEPFAAEPERAPVAVPAQSTLADEPDATASPAGPATEPTADAAPSPVAATEPAETTEPVEPIEPVAAEPVAAEPVAAEPAVVPAPRASAENDAPADAADTAPDDFRRIQGIGPKLATALQDAGIRTYRQLAELDEVTLRQTVKAAGLRTAPGLATWPQQAKVLAGAPADADRVLPAAAE